MTAAFSSNPNSKRRPPQQTPGAATPNNVISLAQARQRKRGIAPSTPTPAEAETVVQIFPEKLVKPWWLKSLTVAQNLCSISTAVLVTTSLALYGMTVYNESIWSKEYQTLERLRRQDQQFRAANEVLKNQIAKDAENPKASSTVKKPMDTMIFLKPAPLRPEVPSEPAPYLDLGARSGGGDHRSIGY
jgi:hypothetical protein